MFFEGHRFWVWRLSCLLSWPLEVQGQSHQWSRVVSKPAREHPRQLSLIMERLDAEMEALLETANDNVNNR